MKRSLPTRALFLFLISLPLILQGCSKAYYGTMEELGVHKRDIMVDRVENARDSQEEAQEQFQSALDQFNSVVQMEQTDLKTAYENLNREYEESEKAAKNVSNRIAKVEDVSEALFDEWEKELSQYSNQSYRRSSEKQLSQTKDRYREMITNMKQAEASMEPVLVIFKDNVLFLKHNLNAQAIGALHGEFNQLQGEIDNLVKKMNVAIESSNNFIDHIKQ